MAVQTLSLPSSGRNAAATGPTLSMSGGPGVPYTGPVATTTPYVAPAQPAPAQPAPAAAVTTTEVQYDDMGNPIDNGIADAARNINEAFPQGMPNYLSSNYRPARSVGTGVAVAPVNSLRDLTNPGGIETITLSRNAPPVNYQPAGAVAQPSYLQEMGTLPGGGGPGVDLQMTGADIAQALSSYDPNSIGYKLAAGYRQLFGREIDPTGAEYYLRNIQTIDNPNQPIASRASQAEINRILLGGAQGGDLEAARDYQLSLTGGRPPISQGQFFQPVYRPESYYNYRETPFRNTVGTSPLGFNPSDFVSFGPTRDLTANVPSGFSNFTPAEKINYLNQIGATPQELMRLDPTLAQKDFDWLRSQGYRGGFGSSVPRMFGPVAQPYTPTASFDTYSGYNPFALGAVNPYASRMQQARPVGRGVSVQQPPRSPFRSFLSRPLAAGGRIEDGIRSVRYR